MAFYSMRGYKKDEENLANPFDRLEKTTVIQEARAFNETPVNVRKCSTILTKILALVNQGETLSTNEATSLFFAVTQLFQSQNEVLRRLVYVCIKELCTQAEDVIIVTSSLTKDMTGREDRFHAASIRALCNIAESDPSIIQGIERYMKQAVVGNNSAVASAALVSSLHLLLSGNHDIVRRWSNEVQEAMNGDCSMVQYHALGLLYHIKRSDRLAVNKLVSRFTSGRVGFLRSPLAMCLLMRIVCKVIQEETRGPEEHAPLLEFLESCLRHKNEMVVYEAAYALVSLRQFGAGSSSDMSSAISVLQLFCSSPKPTMRYTAVRTLSQIAYNQPAAVATCNVDLEQLIADPNRSIATLAITTLLKVGSESSVERLMKQISSFMSEISDEFKIVVVDAVKSLCIKYPRKHQVMMNYLATMLRDEGGYEYKKAIVNTIIAIIEENPEAKEAGLEQLCEFIEDCEHVNLAVRILALLGREGPKTQHPFKCIRYIYNRVILEAAQVRAAAVVALAKFGASNASLLPRVLILLERCMFDVDDEVRDRATFYRALLASGHQALVNQYVLDELSVSLPALERALRDYNAQSVAKTSAFDLSAVPLAQISESESIATAHKKEQHKPTPAATEHAGREREQQQHQKAAASHLSTQAILQDRLAHIPQMQKKLGPLFKSSTTSLQLTESETEYVVKCIKHTFRRHLVFQFECTNTINDQLLEKVFVHMSPEEEDTAAQMRVVGCAPCARLEYDVPGTAFTVVELLDPDSDSASSDAGSFDQMPPAATGTLSCTLKFHVKDCDPNTGEVEESGEGYEDEYVLESVEVQLSDYIQRILMPHFESTWQELGEQNELQSTFALAQTPTIQEAVKNISEFLGMQPCDRSDRVDEKKSSHLLLLSGAYCGNVRMLARVKFVMAGVGGGVTMNLTVRSEDPVVSDVVINSI